MKRNAQRTILVTGGRGFVGAAVVRHLLAQGFTVHVFGPESPVALPEGATQTLASIEDADVVNRCLEDVQPAAVVHCAAFSAGPIGLTRSGEADPERMLAVNVLGFRHLLEACVRTDVPRVVWMSSTVVLGRAIDAARRIDESAPRHPLVQYGMSKVLAEDLAQFYRDRHGLQTIGLRIPLMLGPGLWYQGAASAILDLARQAAGLAEPAELAAPSVAFDAMHVADTGPLVEALITLPGPFKPIYHVAGFTTQATEIAAVLASIVPGFRAMIRPVEPPIIYPLVSQERVERDTGWRHRHDLSSTLNDLLNDLKKR
jgi:UDP-glucose 4-epimerase